MNFTKMHGLGNDFILIDAEFPKNSSDIYDIVKLADRRCGIGFDQAIILNSFDQHTQNFTIKFLNSDGSHAGGCGNGTRAAAGYFHKHTGKTNFRINIALPQGGYDIVDATIIGDHIAQIKMPKPKFLAAQIPLSDHQLDPQKLQTRHFNQDGFCVNIGNPHYVMRIDNEDDFLNFPLQDTGYQIENDTLFPERINVEIIFIQDRNNLKMRVWERGAGITKACGTGACAAVIAAAHQGLVDNKCRVELEGGDLEIYYDQETQDLTMQGAYAFVYEGHIL